MFNSRISFDTYRRTVAKLNWLTIKLSGKMYQKWRQRRSWMLTILNESIVTFNKCIKHITSWHILKKCTAWILDLKEILGNGRQQAVVDQREKEGNANQMFPMLKDLKVPKEKPFEFHTTSVLFVSSPRKSSRKKEEKGIAATLKKYPFLFPLEFGC